MPYRATKVSKYSIGTSRCRDTPWGHQGIWAPHRDTGVTGYPIGPPRCLGALQSCQNAQVPQGDGGVSGTPGDITVSPGGWWPCPQQCPCPQLLRAHVDRAPQITPEFGMEMAHSLLGVLVAFLHRWARGHGGGRGGDKGWAWGCGGTGRPGMAMGTPGQDRGWAQGGGDMRGQELGMGTWGHGGGHR